MAHETKINQKPSSEFFHNGLTVLVRPKHAFRMTQSGSNASKHCAKMANTTGLISSLFNIAWARDVPFCLLKELHCMHHGLTLVLLCVPISFSTCCVSVDSWVACVNGFLCSMIFLYHASYILKRVQSCFSHCSLYVPLCNGHKMNQSKTLLSSI